MGQANSRRRDHTFPRQLHGALLEARINGPVPAHTFRRSCATELIRGGANLWHVKDLLGHENVDTLHHDVCLTIVDLKKRTRSGTRGSESSVELAQEMHMIRTMPMTVDQIVEETSQWPEDVVAELVDRIMLAKHGGVDAAVDTAWRAEAQRRLAELKSGQVQGIPLEDTLAKARKLIGR
jgi:putative addiction module component (TIGR02574 family)